MATTEDALLKVVSDALEAVAAPALTVRPGRQLLTSLPPGSVQVVPLTIGRQPAGGGKQRWTLRVVITVTSRLIAPTATATAWADVLTAVRAAVSAVDSQTLAASVRAAGGEQLLRSEVVLAVKPGTESGAPAGGVFEVELVWTQ